MATWAGIALQHPGWAGLLHPQLGRRSLSAPRQASSPGWAGVFLSLAGPSRHLAPALLPAPAGLPCALPRLGRDSAPRLGRHFAPAGRTASPGRHPSSPGPPSGRRPQAGTSQAGSAVASLAGACLAGCQALSPDRPGHRRPSLISIQRSPGQPLQHTAGIPIIAKYRLDQSRRDWSDRHINTCIVAHHRIPVLGRS
jgi:hypothetical protein